MNIKEAANSIPSLAGGGEMARLTRTKDWSKTSLGSPLQWPQSLLTTLEIILNSRFPMFLWWGPELLCFYNDAYRPSLGKSGKHPDILGMRAEEAWPEIWTIIKPLIDQVLTGGEATWSEDQLIPIYRNGKLEDVYWTFSYSPVKDESGKVAGVLVTCSETTEKVLMLEELKKSIAAQRANDLKIAEAFNELIESRQKLNILLEASELGTWELNIKTDEVNYSDRYLQILGYASGSNITHEQILKHLHPDDLEVREKAFDIAFKTGVLHYESRIIWNDGTIHWIEGKGKLFKDENGEPIKMIGTVGDITEEKRYRRQLEEREQKFRLLADSMPQHIWTSDTNGNLNYFNRSVFKYSGLSPSQIEKDGWLQIVHPDDRQKNIDAWSKAINTGEDFHLEHRFRRHDGVYRWQLSRAIPQKDENGNIRMWVGTSTDIEDQKIFAKELERQVQERTRELEEKNIDLARMNKELQSFAYISSHDLQEPLRKIQTFSSRLLDKEFANLSETGKDQFERMRIAAKRMQTLIDDLLAYSRTNNTERNYEHTDLNKIIEEVKSELKEELEQKHAKLETHELCDANIIPFQFRQLMHNLISNSLKFAKPEVSPVIKIKSKIEEGNKLNYEKLKDKAMYCHISVADNGIGFDQQYSDKIFELFQRLHGRTQYNGTGIGLAIVKKIVENHNGFITAKGEINKGARFDIYIPAD